MPANLAVDQVYYVGGFGVLSKWIPVNDYEKALPDVLAGEAPEIAAKVSVMSAVLCHPHHAVSGTLNAQFIYFSFFLCNPS